MYPDEIIDPGMTITTKQTIAAFFVNVFPIYFIIINIITFLAMWIDKKRAKKCKWRISEPTLLTLGILGGSVGGMIGMYTFRHKTKKKRFTIGFPAILLIEIALVIFYIFF